MIISNTIVTLSKRHCYSKVMIAIFLVTRFLFFQNCNSKMESSTIPRPIFDSIQTDLCLRYLSMVATLYVDYYVIDNMVQNITENGLSDKNGQSMRCNVVTKSSSFLKAYSS